MDPYESWLRDVLRLAGELYFKEVENRLGEFTQALYEWLYELFEHPRANWREEFAAFVAAEEAAGCLLEPVSQTVVLDYLASWWAARERETAAVNLAVPGALDDVQLDGTRIHSKRYFELPEDVGLPQLPETEGAGTLDELLDPELPSMVRSAEEYRRSQRAAHGDSPGAMGLFGLNQAINRYVWGIEDRHEALESPGEHTANDIADTAAAVSDMALGAAGAGKRGKIPSNTAIARKATSPAVWKPEVTHARVHGNSLEYVGETHVYVVRGPEGAVKIGESMQGVRVGDGASIRGEAQARALSKETGELHRSKVLRTFSNKRAARDHESRVIERFRRMHGEDTLPGNKTNR